MGSFTHAFSEGMAHIFCLDAADHILFLLALVARFDYTKVKHLFWMVTAFTLGHAFTFILAVNSSLPGVREYAETAIPITIALTAIVTLLAKDKKGTAFGVSFLVYLMALAFGGIHGLAIGSMLKMKIVGDNFLTQLVGFNLGIELAQILVVIGIMALQYLLVLFFNLKRTAWRLGASGVALGCSLMMLKDILTS